MPLATTVCDCTGSLTPDAFRIPGRLCYSRTRSLPLKPRCPSLRAVLRPYLCVLAGSLLSTHALSAGTPAGISISNTATADYVIAGSGGTASSTVSFRVDEKLDVNVSWQDASNITVSTPDTDRVTTWLLTNTGNGSDSYTLAVNNALAGDQFDPLVTDIWLDADSDGLFNAAFDTLYAPAVNDPVLLPDTSQVVFVRNSMPNGLNNGDLGNTELIATSNTASGVPGTAIANAGDSNTTAVVGTSGGRSADTGVHQVADTSVALVKSVVVSDPFGGNQPVTGATLTYSIDASVSGPGTATGVVISDLIPANTSYNNGTLTLNAIALSDGADADAGDVNATVVNTVTVDLGDMTSASPTQTISFAVTIN